MAIKVGINGFGCIGRQVVRAARETQAGIDFIAAWQQFHSHMNRFGPGVANRSCNGNAAEPGPTILAGGSLFSGVTRMKPDDTAGGALAGAATRSIGRSGGLHDLVTLGFDRQVPGARVAFWLVLVVQVLARLCLIGSLLLLAWRGVVPVPL
ncbi:MAG TPA: hypothetical protein VF981_05390 [Gemmatimonadaceae bacterium]